MKRLLEHLPPATALAIRRRVFKALTAWLWRRAGKLQRGADRLAEAAAQMRALAEQVGQASLQVELELRDDVTGVVTEHPAAPEGVGP